MKNVCSYNQGIEIFGKLRKNSCGEFYRDFFKV